jgi:hypothetical protein
LGANIQPNTLIIDGIFAIVSSVVIFLGFKVVVGAIDAQPNAPIKINNMARVHIIFRSIFLSI